MGWEGWLAVAAFVVATLSLASAWASVAMVWARGRPRVRIDSGLQIAGVLPNGEADAFIRLTVWSASDVSVPILAAGVRGQMPPGASLPEYDLAFEGLRESATLPGRGHLQLTLSVDLLVTWMRAGGLQQPTHAYVVTPGSAPILEPLAAPVCVMIARQFSMSSVHGDAGVQLPA